jgi:hypothetical protein
VLSGVFQRPIYGIVIETNEEDKNAVLYDCIELLNSLQRPKKIRVYGSDGKTYIILLKRGDDLRKDNCLIDKFKSRV